MLTAHETVKTAWSKFKSYPRFKQIFFYNLLAMLPIVGAEYYIGDDSSLGFLIFLASIPSLIFYFLTYMAITHYACTEWIFNSFHEFLNPPSSIWRLFWKSIVLFLMLTLPVIIGAIAVSALIGLFASNIIVSIIMGAIVAVLFLVYLLKYLVKIIVIYPYFTMNDRAPLLASLKFSDGQWWYLSSVLGWTLLYGFLFLILFVVTTTVIGLLSILLTSLVTVFVVSVLMILMQIFFTVMTAFINSEAYKQIAENKS